MKKKKKLIIGIIARKMLFEQQEIFNGLNNFVV